MAAKWQQWMPLHIDKWRGSPAVKAMHPAARAGYLDLLIFQWQSDDCSISSDPIDLADCSGLGDELWAVYGTRILRNFEVLPDGRLRNAVCFEQWQEAKKVFEARKNAAHRTNKERSPHGHRTVTDDIAPRSADTITETVTDTEKQKPLPANRGTRIPEGYQPTAEHKELSAKLGVNLREEFPRFRDYWTAKAGKDAVKLDWDATLRNWIRNASERNGGSNGKTGTPHQSATKQRIDASRRVLAEIAIKRGLVGSSGPDGWAEPPLPFAGTGGVDGGVSGGLREIVPEILSPQG